MGVEMELMRCMVRVRRVRDGNVVGEGDLILVLNQARDGRICMGEGNGVGMNSGEMRLMFPRPAIDSGRVRAQAICKS